MSDQNLIWVVLAALLLVGVLIGPSQWSLTDRDQAVQKSGSSRPQAAAHKQPTLGSADAPVTMVEFAEFYCPYCANFHWQTFPRIKEEFIDTGKVKYIFRNLVVHGDAAQLAAKAGECALRQDAFWKFHNRIFEVVFKERKEYLSEEDLLNIAGELGLNKRAIKSCLNSAKIGEEIQKDRKRLRDLIDQLPAEEKEKAQRIGTPTFFINGHILIGAQPYSEFKRVIKEELEKAG